MKRTKRWAMIMAVLLAALMVISLLLSILMTYGAAASALDTKKNQLNAIKEDKKRIQSQLDAATSTKMTAINQKIALDQHIKLSEEEIDSINDLIQEYTVQIANTQLQYEEAVKAEVDKEARFLERLRVMEEVTEPHYISILMQSNSFSDLLGRVSIVAEIAEADRIIMEELRVAREDIEATKAQLKLEQEEQSKTKQELVLAQDDLLRQYNEMDAMIANLEAKIDEYKKAYETADAEMASVSNDIKKIMEENARKNTKFVGGGMIWPCPGYTNITSHFGTRKHPVLKTQKFHSGTDIGAPTGTKIVAAYSGTVILSAYNGGYGNCISIDHGGGIATLYGHCSKLLVKKGDVVKQGAVIALVGSTGLSTGPHLHFEIIKNGAKVNPMTFKG